MTTSFTQLWDSAFCKRQLFLSKKICVTMLIWAFALKGFAQVTVTGTVTDYDGEVLPGVNILEKGTTNGTITSIDGKFQISVAPDAVLVFSYIGYLSEEEP